MSEKNDKNYEQAKESGVNEKVAEQAARYRAEVMGGKPLFNDVLEAADTLSLDDQEELVFILKKRISEKRREEILESARAGREEFERGESKRFDPDELKNELLS